jgi:hypothetical protein
MILVEEISKRVYVKHSQVMSKTNKIKSRKGKKSSQLNPGIGAITYNGPTIPRNYLSEDIPVVIPVGVTNTLASSAGGVIQTVLDSVVQVTAAADWTSIAALYKEYRVLSMDVEFSFIDPYKTGVTALPVYSATDRQNNTALASLTDVSSYDSAIMHQWSKNFRRKLKMDTVEEAMWTSISNTPSGESRLYVKLYGTGLGATVNVLQYFARYLVQVKGRQ